MYVRYYSFTKNREIETFWHLCLIFLFKFYNLNTSYCSVVLKLHKMKELYAHIVIGNLDVHFARIIKFNLDIYLAVKLYSVVFQSLKYEPQ